MNPLDARIAGIGFWASGLPSWEAAQAFVADGRLPDAAPRRPSPELLAPNERRRAPESVAVALEVALAATRAAGHDPTTLASIFTSGHGDFAITGYMCETLADDPRAISPIRFHNSVHNAAAGYWTIGAGCTATTTAISAGPATFAQGLLEALVQLATGTPAVLLVAYDVESSGLLGTLTPSRGLLGGALVLTRADAGDGPLLRASLRTGAGAPPEGPLALRLRDNAMAPMLPLFDALAAGAGRVLLDAGAAQALEVEVEGMHV
ncbi:beta-ketoacyl synthase chain length factor [Luteimonas yindakuii]|uniref:beta-ketoacyl synthase chain length factor n=1 Tax=Luteimonas yindakuii TaxID=2565782 RepID=UPI0010A49ACA|nr:beta-ketoacyl synthase chain length factor [Luteimonas yindakuii]QCO68575.1 beta-ketoacyl synthase chain length factor [Luteimonas yindakuii]